MRTTFRGYYQPTEEEFSQLWKDSDLVFDANVLLNIYRYSQETREALINIFIKFSDRLWVPHQAAMEYQRRRLEVIGKKESDYKDIQGLLAKEQTKIENDLNTYKMHPFIKVADIIIKINKNFNEIRTDLETLNKTHPDLIAKDELRDKITELFNGKVGPSYSPEKLEEIYKAGKKRYDRKIPPGFEDKGKDGVREFGDLVLWFQIIDHAKETKKSIIFVTDDKKEDWWLKFKGTVGPQPELINEIFTNASVNFYMYQAERFIKYAQEYLGEKVNQKAIDEIRQIKKLDEKKKELEEDQFKEKLTNSISKSLSASIAERCGGFPTSSSQILADSISGLTSSQILADIISRSTSSQILADIISRSASSQILAEIIPNLSNSLILASLTSGDLIPSTSGDLHLCSRCKNYGKQEDIRCKSCGYMFGCD